MDNHLVHSPMLEQQLFEVAEERQIFRRLQLYVKSYTCEFRRSSASSAIDSAKGVSVDPRKVQSIVEWTMPKSCSKVRCFTELANYYRRLVLGYAE